MICPRCRKVMILEENGSKKQGIAERYTCIKCGLYVIAPKVSKDAEEW